MNLTRAGRGTAPVGGPIQPRVNRRWRLLAALAATAMLIAGCGSSPTTTATTTTVPVDHTGVKGTVMAGPTCPVERFDQPCPPQPVEGTVTAIDSRNHIAATTSTDADGRYALDLVPGRYTLQVAVDGPLPSCPDTAVTVTTGAPTTADIDCDTGIR
jgi:hypothetical protein